MKLIGDEWPPILPPLDYCYYYPKLLVQDWMLTYFIVVVFILDFTLLSVGFCGLFL